MPAPSKMIWGSLTNEEKIQHLENKISQWDIVHGQEIAGKRRLQKKLSALQKNA
tara:strand:+ start:290 stop:451 length:162 start_codon:yes stop_codon:yes gene_type:complete